MTAYISAFPAFAEENRGFSLSNFFKIKKAEDQDQYRPVEQEKKPAIVISGNAGPKMPAVPAGEIKKEVIVTTMLPPQPAPKIVTLEEKQKAQPPPVTVEYNPDIPFMTLMFQHTEQRNLEPAHQQILEDTLKTIKTGFYHGKIRIQSFSDGQSNKPAMDRALKVREYLLQNGIALTDLDVQALPSQKQGNAIHIFLLGES